MSKSFCLLDDSMTLHGIRFKPEGGDMSRFKENPILLFMHARGNVLGRWNNIRLEAGRWLADAEFDMDDPEAAKLAGKVERGFIKACSMGVFPLEMELIGGEPWAIKWGALEGSIVDAGSNANALQLCSPNGEVIEDAALHILNLTIPIMDTKKLPGDDAAAPVIVPKLIALAAGLAEDATEILVAEAIHKIVNENKTLKLAAETSKATQVKDLLDLAVSSGKIAAPERGHYETLAAVNYESVKAIIGKMTAPVDLVALAAGGKTASFNTDEDLAKQYSDLDKSGKLYSLKAKEPETFKALYLARWGKEFKEE